VETEGPHSDTGTRKGSPDGNVVPFPRDWLGPREELVPFGGPERIGDGEPPDASGPVTPPTAADFWSEEAVAVHDAFQAPASSVDLPVGGPGAEKAAKPRRERRRRVVGKTDGRQPERQIGRVKPLGVIRAPWRLASVLGTLVLLAALLVVSLPRSSAPRVASRPTQTATSDLTMFGPLMSRTEQDLSSVGQVALHRWPRRPSANRPVKRSPYRQTPVTPKAASNGSEGLPAATSTSVPAAPLAASSTSSPAHSASTASNPPSQPAPSPPAPAVSASATSSTTESSSPSSQPAFGADGTLGPGHSSNG
jgi:hypothetical protein